MPEIGFSADLEELAMTNVAVISAGAKSILDLRLTLESNIALVYNNCKPGAEISVETSKLRI